MKFKSCMLGLLAVLCAESYAAPVCSWDRPGANPYVGEVPAAVDRYRELPAEVRGRLKERMQRLDYDEIVEIRRDTISGKDRNYGNLRGMHFGNGGFCENVSRARWKDEHTERGLVYCEKGHCILVPTVCRNVSLVDVLPEGTPAAPTEETVYEEPQQPRMPWVLPGEPQTPQTFDGRPGPYTQIPPPVWPYPPGPGFWYPPTPPVQNVPEPGTLSLFAVGALFVAGLCRRRRP